MMSIEDQIFINKLAQGRVEMSSGLDWFSSLDEESRHLCLQEIGVMILNASPRKDEIENACRLSGLKPTTNAVRSLLENEITVGLHRLTQLGGRSSRDGFLLSILLLGVSDRRRKDSAPLDLVNHWWHRDLDREEVVQAIIEAFQKGIL